MAEESGDPVSEDPLSKRISEYYASGKAQEHFLQGFAQAPHAFLTVEEFKKRESGGKRPTVGKGSVHQGNQVRTPLISDQPAVCRAVGHDWSGEPEAHRFVCRRCGTERHPTVAIDDQSIRTRAEAFSELSAKFPPKVIIECYHCGERFDTTDERDEHEASC